MAAPFEVAICDFKMGGATELGMDCDQFAPFPQAEPKRGQGRKRAGMG
jgi:hypothetical protein